MLTFKCVENSSFASSFYAVKGTDQSEIILRFMKVISSWRIYNEFKYTDWEFVNNENKYQNFRNIYILSKSC